MSAGRRMLALGLLAAVLSVTVFMELSSGPAADASTAELGVAIVTRQRSAPEPYAGAAEREKWVASMLARPLFAPSRRPPKTDDAVIAGALGADLPRLAGILISPGVKFAFFAIDGSAKPIVASEGGRVGAYRVLSIAVGQVIVQGADGVHVLHPRFGTSPQLPAAAALPARHSGFAARTTPDVGDSD